MSLAEMNADELRTLYTSMEKRYLSTTERVEDLEALVLSLRAQNAILGAEKAQWAGTQGIQNGVIQQQLAIMDTEKQEMADEIERLRARLRSKDSE